MGAAGTGPFSGNSDLHQGQTRGGMRFMGLELLRWAKIERILPLIY